jgi:type II secretory pathway predicted ATPase ExeA
MIGKNSFKSSISIENIFLGDQHKEALARAMFVLDNCGIFLLYGEPGSGKSTLIRLFISQLDPSRYSVCYINNSRLTPKDLYSSVLESLAVSPYHILSKVKKQFYEVLGDVFNNHQKQLVVLIDNAQSLPMQTVNEIRYMRSFEYDSISPISLILIGHQDLLPMLRLRTFEPLFYRINSQYHFKGLTRNQTSDYIEKQLSLSGLSMLFPDEIISKIWGRSKGLPQIINTICTSCLIDMAANSLKLVDNAVLERVLADLHY